MRALLNWLLKLFSSQSVSQSVVGATMTILERACRMQPSKQTRAQQSLCAALAVLFVFMHGADGYDENTELCNAETDSTLFVGSWVQTSPIELPPCCGGDRVGKFIPGRVGKTWDAGCGTTRMRTDATGQYGGLKSIHSAWAETGGHGCACHRPADNLDYEWRTNNACTVRSWNASLFCGEPPYRTIRIVGDSVSGQLATTLINAIKIDGGGCHHSISHSNADTLLGRPFGHMNRGPHWLDILRRDMPDVIVLNAAAHIFGRENFTAVRRTIATTCRQRTVFKSDRPLTSLFKRAHPLLQVVQEVAADAKSLPQDILSEYLQAARKPPTVVWRTNTPGGCTRTPVQQWPQNSTRHPAGVDKLFNHAEFLEWDNAAVRVFADAKIPVVDLRMLYLRSDAHVAVNPWNKAPDCLHYCLRNSALHRTFPRMVQHAIGDHGSLGGGYLKDGHT